MRKSEFVKYHYLVLALIRTFHDYRILYDVICYIFSNYNFSVKFCNSLYSFILERSKFYEIQR